MGAGYFSDHIKTQGMCERAIEDESETLEYVPNHFKTQMMCERAVENEPDTLKFVPDHFKTQRMCERAVENEPYNLKFVPDQYKTQGMCDDAVWEDPYSLRLISDWFVTQQQLKIWNDYDNYCNNDKLIEWYDGYQKRKAQKASIKEELMPIAWHPSRWWDWCVPEDEEKEMEKLWV